ncbi:MAG TPA: hypothetical protein VFY89_06700, partial [Ktedonobacterales bacterium]
GAALLALRGVRRAWASRAKWTPASRMAAYRSIGQLAVLGGAALTLLAYALSPAPVLAPLDTGRYLVGLWIATPALLAPLALPRLAREQAPPEPIPVYARARLSRIRLRALPLALILAVLALGVAATWREVPGKRQITERSQALIASLARAGVTRVYSDYWTCDQLMFESRERVICAVLAPQMNAGYDRYPPYAAMVHAAAHPAFLFPLGSPQAGIIARFADHAGGVRGGAGGPALDVAPDAVLPDSPRYHLQRLDGYVLYRYPTPTDAKAG